MSANPVILDGSSLTLDQLYSVAREGAFARLHPNARQRVEASAETLRALSKSDQTIYGVNTGFGVFADRRIELEQAEQLSLNLILSHVAGVGPPFPADVVRAAILIRANTLAAGHSGVRPLLIETLLHLLEEDIVPYVPSQGSLGSSGDLAPLAHLAQVFTAVDGEHATSESADRGQAWYRGELMSGRRAMNQAGLAPIRLGPKEGLALTNGATFSAALLALSILDIAQHLAQAEVASAMSLEALLAGSQPFDDRLHASRNHPGQRSVAARLRKLTAGSDFLDSGSQVQDAYSLRCIPQIHGPAEELLAFTAAIAEREMNSATDNPLLYAEDVISGGNFHGQPLGLAADYLKLPLAETGALAERRVFRLTTPHHSQGLPPMLVGEPDQAGLQSGLMMLQYTAASLALENLTLGTADSLHSLPTSAGQEDLNANSTTAARNLRSILTNVRRITAIELLCSAQAVDLRKRENPNKELGHGTAVAHLLVREITPFVERDRPPHADIEAVTRALEEALVLSAVEKELGPLPGWEILHRGGS